MSICVILWANEWKFHQRPEEKVTSLKDRITGACDPPDVGTGDWPWVLWCGYWRLTLGPLQEQQEFLLPSHLSSLERLLLDPYPFLCCFTASHLLVSGAKLLKLFEIVKNQQLHFDHVYMIWTLHRWSVTCSSNSAQHSSLLTYVLSLKLLK